jgi:chromosome segregation ATPase
MTPNSNSNVRITSQNKNMRHNTNHNNISSIQSPMSRKHPIPVYNSGNKYNSFHFDNDNEQIKQNYKYEDNKIEMVDKVTEDLRNFYEKLIKSKDEQIHELNSEIEDLKNMLTSRTEQANENIKKMAKINISMKNELDYFKKINKELENDLIKTKNQYVKLNDVDECYKTLRRDKQNLQVENDELRNKIKELSNYRGNPTSNYRSNDDNTY